MEQAERHREEKTMLENDFIGILQTLKEEHREENSELRGKIEELQREIEELKV